MFLILLAVLFGIYSIIKASDNVVTIPIVKLTWFNVANSYNDEKSLNHRYAQRELSLIKVIKESMSDVICISELRTCSNVERTGEYTPEQLAIRISRGTGLEIAAIRPQNLDHMSFWRTTLYRSDKVVHLQSFCKWAIAPVFDSSKVEERGVMLLFSRFRAKGSVASFWVINSHMPLQYELKMQTIEWLNENVADICAGAARPEDPRNCMTKVPIIFYGGDQNTFEENRSQMLNAFSKRWEILSGNINQTFRSFPYENCQYNSTLDHIFVHNQGNMGPTALGYPPGHILDTATVQALDTKGASDHFLISLEVEIP